MQFNPTDKSKSLIADIDFLLFGASATLNTKYALADRTRNINAHWDEALSILYRADPSFKWDDTTNSDIPIATLALVSGQDHYTLLDSAQVIHRLRMKDANGKYITLDSVTRSELSDSDLATTNTGTPSKYYKMGGVIFPVPVPNYSASAGVEVEFQRSANHFTTTDTDTSPGFATQFHRFLSIGASLDYAIAKGMTKKVVVLEKQKQQMADAMREHYQMRSPDERPNLSLAKRSQKSYGL